MNRVGMIVILALAMTGIGCAASASSNAKPAQRKVFLTWVDHAQPNGLSVVKQNLHRNTSGCAQAAQVTTPLPPSVTSTTDANVKKNGTYHYWISIVDNLGRESVPSNCVTATVH